MIRVITVAREYGSGGAAVAAALAERLGWRLLDRALLERAARAADCDPAVAEELDERVDNWLERLAHSLGHGGFDGVAMPDAGGVDAERMAEFTRQVLTEAAELGGCVIVGRGAQCALRERADALHLFVYSTWPARVQRLRARLGPEADVKAAIDHYDRERAAYLKTHYGHEWTDRTLYHLMLNSAPGIETVVTAVLAVVSALNHAQ